MKKVFGLLAAVFIASQAHAWGYASGKVDVVYVSAYGSHNAPDLNGGYCFKLVGYAYHFKIKFADSGEQKSNLQQVQSIVMAASMSGRELKATFVDWEDTTCRINGAAVPAKWLETLQMAS